nr:glycosyltransferase [Variovorax paradoxus]
MTPRLALDMYVLAQGVKTGVYRVCSELYGRLAVSSRFSPRLFVRDGDELKAGEYIAANGLPGKLHDSRRAPSADADILLSPFGVAPRKWLDDENVLQAHIIYDLIAINRPDYFSLEAATEVRNIIASLDERTVIFAISEFTKKELLAYRPDLSPGQISVIPLAAGGWFKPCDDAQRRAAMRAKYRIPAGAPYVLSLATLEIRKNLDQVVHAFLRHMRQSPSSDTRLVLAGMSGWKLEKFDVALAAAGEFRDRIILTGFVEDADLSALYSDALCFVYLSRYEGFGLPPLEAMACGTPVICADNSSLPEVVGDAGIMLDADDVDGVARAIERIRSSTDEREALSRKGLQRSRLFDWDRCAAMVTDALLEAYRRHVARPAYLRRSQAALLSSDSETSVRTDREHPRASYLGYENGGWGLVFNGREPGASCGVAAWPLWADVLQARAAGTRPEGGLRTRGIMKSGTVDEPLVSYVTVVYNNTATLARTIESVQKQTYKNVEHIVLDGASTDGTVDLILQYADRLDYFVSESDRGLYDAINKAVPLARGQLICILNSDDWLEPHAAEIAVRRMRPLVQQPALLATGATVYGIDGQIALEWHPAFVHPGSYFTCANDCHNGVYATRAAYEYSGPYDTSYKIAADFKWLMTCLDAGARFVYTREVTVNYSMGGTSGDARGHSLECLRVVSERFPFLSQAEVRGLYDCYFALTHQLSDERTDRVDTLTLFLRRVFAAHVDKPEFLAALGWAAMTKLEHPLDLPPSQAAPHAAPAIPSVRRSAKDLVKGLLHRYPLLYAAAIRGYSRMRR